VEGADGWIRVPWSPLTSATSMPTQDASCREGGPGWSRTPSKPTRLRRGSGSSGHLPGRTIADLAGAIGAALGVIDPFCAAPTTSVRTPSVSQEEVIELRSQTLSAATPPARVARRSWVNASTAWLARIRSSVAAASPLSASAPTWRAAKRTAGSFTPAHCRAGPSTVGPSSFT
jgi:hypothetical protein